MEDHWKYVEYVKHLYIYIHIEHIRHWHEDVVSTCDTYFEVDELERGLRMIMIRQSRKVGI